MKRIVIVLVICILILITLLGLLIFKLNGENNNSDDVVSIDFFALKTYSGFDGTINNIKYRITDQEELEMFCTLYNGFELSENYDLSNNTIFIQTPIAGCSGSTSVNFKSVSINKEIKFNVSTNSPKIGTADLVYWYFVAIVPNTKLNGVNVNEWKSPIDVNNSLP